MKNSQFKLLTRLFQKKKYWRTVKHQKFTEKPDLNYNRDPLYQRDTCSDWIKLCEKLEYFFIAKRSEA
tara:strand:+ start:225 stop:428 length:204 start_codon:yes stop_codon:yes gene_type:complete